jgi:tetratricopeptide (TPR) repeat protein
MTLSAGREAEGQYSQAIALAVSEGANIEPRRIAAVHYKRQITRVPLGNYLAALSDCQQALIAASETGDEDLLFDVRVNTAYTQLMAERIDEAIKVACEIERSAEPPPGGSKRLRYLNFDVQLKMGLGDLDQAALMGDSAVTLARSLGDAERLLTSLGVRAQLHYHHAEYASALPLLQEVCRLGVDKRRLGDPRPLYIYFGSTVYLGLTLGDLGHVSEALVTLQSGLEMARADGYGFWVPRLLSAIGWVYGDIGALGDALQYAEDAAAEAVGQDTEIRVESRLNLALVYLRLGRMDRAPSLLAEADMLNRQNVLFAWPWRIHYATAAAEDALARGAPVRATEFAREGNALARATECGNTSSLPSVCWPKPRLQSTTGRRPERIFSRQSTSSPSILFRSSRGRSMRLRHGSTGTAALSRKQQQRSSKHEIRRASCQSEFRRSRSGPRSSTAFVILSASLTRRARISDVQRNATANRGVSVTSSAASSDRADGFFDPPEAVIARAVRSFFGTIPLPLRGVLAPAPVCRATPDSSSIAEFAAGL